jgi:hypothetical protein
MKHFSYFYQELYPLIIKQYRMKLFKKSFFFGIHVVIFVFFINMNAQTSNTHNSQQITNSDFWNKVRFGGGLGLNFGSGFTEIMIAPSAIYEFNEYVATGVGLQWSYINVKNRSAMLNDYTANAYGGSWIILANPIPELQLSAELEQLRVNVNFSNGKSDDFWNTALFLGAGFRTQNVTAGVRYNVLHKTSKNVYHEALMPFVRIYF